MAEVLVNDKHAATIAFPPYNADISGFINPGTIKVEVRVTGSLKNLLGPHHNNTRPGLASPWSWRNVTVYPSGSEYKMNDYGLLEDFVLLNGE